MTQEHRRRAYGEAAALILRDMDTVDMPGDMTYDEQEAVREFIRTVIYESLLRKSRRVARGGGR